MAIAYIKTTLDGRKVEVIDGWICLGGAREADALIPMEEHPNRQAIRRRGSRPRQTAWSKP
jgi:hypothetical protein